MISTMSSGSHVASVVRNSAGWPGTTVVVEPDHILTTRVSQH